jgi:hypothetical protein
MMPPTAKEGTVAVDGWRYLMKTVTRREAVAEQSTAAPRHSFGMLLTVLVVGAFATGWHYGRRWVQVIGW